MRPFPGPRLLAACLAPLLLAAGDGTPEARFQSLGPDCAKVCAPCGDDFLVVPDFDPRRGASRSGPSADLRRDLTRSYAWKHHGQTDMEKAEPSEAELRAAQPLPGLEQGAYGFLASAQVVKILGPREMVVADARLTDLKREKAEEEDFTRKTQAAMDQSIAKETRALDAKVAALEKEKKSLEAWRRYGQSAGQSSATGGASSSSPSPSSSQGDAASAKAEEIGRQIRALETQKSEALHEEKANKAEVTRVARARLKTFQDAEKLQSKHRKDFQEEIRLVGFDTTKTRAGDRFDGEKGEGFQAAVAFKDADGRWVLASTDLLKKPLDLPGLKALLAKRGASLADFADTVARAREGRKGEDAAVAARAAMARWMKPLPEDAKPQRKKRKSED